MDEYDFWWPEISMATKEISGFRCQRCYKEFEPGKDRDLHVHHRDLDKTNNKGSNLLVLCRWCHFQIHREDDPLFYDPRNEENPERHVLRKPVRVKEVLDDIVPKIIKIQRVNLKGG